MRGQAAQRKAAPVKVCSGFQPWWVKEEVQRSMESGVRDHVWGLPYSLRIEYATSDQRDSPPRVR